MSVLGWIRDFIGIRKDVVETKKAKLEVRRLKDEEQERSSIIKQADLEDVKKYDPKTRKLLRIVKDIRRSRQYCYRPCFSFWALFLTLLTFLLIYYLIKKVL